MIEALARGELAEKVLALTGEERIFIQINEQYARDIRYLGTRKEGLDNIFLSYLNRTAESVDDSRLDMFLDRATKLEIEKQDKFAEIGHQYLGKELFEYLRDPLTPHAFLIDGDREYIIIHHRSINGAGFEACGCGSGSCGI